MTYNIFINLTTDFPIKKILKGRPSNIVTVDYQKIKNNAICNQHIKI